MNPKKLHEVCHMAGLVQDVCRLHSVRIVLDVGAGLLKVMKKEIKDKWVKENTKEEVWVKEDMREQEEIKVMKKEEEEEKLMNEEEEVEVEKLTEEKEIVEEDVKMEVCSELPQHEDQSHKGHLTETDNWLNYIIQELPADMRRDRAYQLTLGLDVTDTPQTRTKLKLLLQVLTSKVACDVEECSSSSRVGVCIVGLHCCGTLANTILQLFSERLHQDVKCLVMLGCCYHKTGSSYWTPMSQELSRLSEKYITAPARVTLANSVGHEGGRSSDFLTTFGLRLAAQETKERWAGQSAASHENHMKQVAFRGILQAVLEKRSRQKSKMQSIEEGEEDARCGEIVVPGRLRGVKCENIEDYALGVASSLQDASLFEAVMDFHSSHLHHFNFIQPFTALQVCLQGVLESVLLRDQQQFLREKGSLNVQLLPVFTPQLSPRNMAILATAYNE